jgi:hypothetical protein
MREYEERKAKAKEKELKDKELKEKKARTSKEGTPGEKSGMDPKPSEDKMPSSKPKDTPSQVDEIPLPVAEAGAGGAAPAPAPGAGMMAGMGGPGGRRGAGPPKEEKPMLPVTIWGRYAKILMSLPEFTFIN